MLHGPAARVTEANLHFNRIPFFQRPVQDTWCVNHLPPHVLVVHMAYVQALGGERIWLYLNVCARYTVDKRRFPHIRIPAHKKCASMWVYGGQPGHVLSDLLQICQRSCLPLHQRAHATLHTCDLAAVTINLFATHAAGKHSRAIYGDSGKHWQQGLHTVSWTYVSSTRASDTLRHPSKVRNCVNRVLFH